MRSLPCRRDLLIHGFGAQSEQAALMSRIDFDLRAQASAQRHLGRTFELQPSIVGRIGWSQGWTRVGRRVFVYLEPKLRPSLREDDGVRRFAPNPVLALVVGSGRGR